MIVSDFRHYRDQFPSHNLHCLMHLSYTSSEIDNMRTQDAHTRKPQRTPEAPSGRLSHRRSIPLPSRPDYMPLLPSPHLFADRLLTCRRPYFGRVFVRGLEATPFSCFPNVRGVKFSIKNLPTTEISVPFETKSHSLRHTERALLMSFCIC